MRDFVPYPFTPKRHAPRVPELHAGAERKRHPVVIVGGGVVGLMTALALARCGVRSVVLEADDSVCSGSRAICISRRSLEILARYGALQPFLATGLPWSGGRSYYRDAEVLRFSMPHADSQRLPPMINIQQYYIEQFLLDTALGTGQVEVRWQHRVRRIEHDARGARLSVGTPLGDYRLETDWLIGCDGARSLVREASGLKLQGASYEGRYVIADIRLRSTRPTERLAWFDPPTNPGGTILMHRQPDDVWRIDYQLRDDEDPDEAVAPEQVIPRIASHLAWIGERDDWAPIWISLYRANALTLERYRTGCLLLAGDAAHLVPIFGVRGANSGLEDADNLAWKLALVIGGGAPEALLESYSSERVAAARANLREGMKSTEFMSPPSFGFDLMRRAVLSLAIRHPSVRSLINPRQTQPATYEGVSAIAGDECDWGAGPPPGTVALDAPVTIIRAGGEASGHLTELLEPHFTLICFSEHGLTAGGAAESRNELQRHGATARLILVTRKPPEPMPTDGVRCAIDRDGRLFSLYGALTGTTYLLRPDGYVLARSRGGSAAPLVRAVQALFPGVPARAEVLR